MKQINLFDTEFIKIIGLPFIEEEHLNRFPKEDFIHVIQENKDLDFLSYHLSGGSLFFETNAEKLTFEITYNNEPLMNHMSPLGESGFDVYLMNDGEFIFYDSIRPFPRQNSIDISLNLPHIMNHHIVMMHTPNYARILRASLHVNERYYVKPYYPKYQKRIFFYGTSITQGACASRPGLSYTNQIARHLKAEVINMGFSGNGLGELSVAAVTHRIKDLDMVVIDYDANAGAVGKLKPSLIPFIECIREVHSNIPIVIISRIPFTREIFDNEDHRKRLDHREYQNQVAQIPHLQPLHFIDGESLIYAHEHEVTVDGIHLNDVGMTLYAQRLAPLLNELMNW